MTIINYINIAKPPHNNSKTNMSSYLDLENQLLKILMDWKQTWFKVNRHDIIQA